MQSSQVRIAELNNPFNARTASQVDKERQQMIHTPINTIFSNKFIAYSRESFNRYLEAFSTKNLFTRGDDVIIISPVYHGFFYYIDFFLLLVGIYVLFKKSKKFFLLWTGLVLIAPIPSVLSNIELSYSLRSSLLYPLLIIPIGVSFAYVLTLRIKNIPSFIIPIGIISIYIFSVANFLFIYFVRSPIYNSEAFIYSSRVLARYLQLANETGNKVVVYTSEPQMLFKQYLFHTDSYSRKGVLAVQDAIRNKKYTLDNITFVYCDNKVEVNESVITITSSDKRCGASTKDGGYITLPQLSDSGSLYTIYNDTVCSSVLLNPHVPQFSITDFAVEQQDRNEFCGKQLIQYHAAR